MRIASDMSAIAVAEMAKPQRVNRLGSLRSIALPTGPANAIDKIAIGAMRRPDSVGVQPLACWAHKMNGNGNEIAVNETAATAVLAIEKFRSANSDSGTRGSRVFFDCHHTNSAKNSTPTPSNSGTEIQPVMVPQL